MEADKYIFNNDDFDTFKNENRFRTDTEIGARRKSVQNKLKHIHEELQIKLLQNNFNISRHYSKKNLTALPYINITTPKDAGINWLGIRYGVSESEAKKQGLPMTGKDKISGFLDHQCIQINITADCIEIGLVHATKNGTFDNAYIKKRLENNDKILEKEIVKEIRNMYGYGLKWHIGDKCFDIDKDDPNEFIDFYIKNDYAQLYSICSIEIPKFDIRVTKENFINTSLFYIGALYPMYLTLSYKKS